MVYVGKAKFEGVNIIFICQNKWRRQFEEKQTQKRYSEYFI